MDSKKCVVILKKTAFMGTEQTVLFQCFLKYSKENTENTDRKTYPIDLVIFSKLKYIKANSWNFSRLN